MSRPKIPTSLRHIHRPSTELMAGMASALGLTLSAVVPAQAQTAGADAITLPTISVEAEQQRRTEYNVEKSSSPKLTEPLVDTPKSITIIPKEYIQDRQATSLTEVLRTVPGIALGAGEGGISAGDRTFIRGFDARGDIYVDGIRDFGSYFRDPFNLEQVEVFKGPSSAYVGQGSTGGALNQITKTPHKEASYGGSVTLGTDLTRRATLDLNQPLTDDIAIRLNAVGHGQDVAKRDEVEQHRFGVAPSIAFGLSGPTQLVVDYLHLRQDNLPDYGHPFDPTTGRPVSVDHSNFYGLVDRDHDKADVDIVTARFSHEFNENLKVRSAIRYGDTHRDVIVTKPEIGAATPPDAVTRSVRTRYSNDEVIANQTDLTAEFNTFGLGHTLVTGFELTRQTSKTRGRTGGSDPLDNTDRSDPDPHDDFVIDPAFNGARNRGRLETAALFAFDTIKINEQFELNGGLRWDYIDSDYEARDAAGVNSSFNRTDKVLNWQVGGVYKPLPNGSIYVAFGSSSNPSAEYLTLSANTTDTDPERTKSYELGTKWEFFDQKLLLTGAIFRTDKTNARVTDPISGLSELQGKQRVDGFEIGFNGEIIEGLNVFGGYTYLDSELVKSADGTNEGNAFVAVPRHSFAIWATYEFAQDWEIGFGANYMSKRYADAANNFELPSFWRFDAMAAYDVTDDIRIQLNVLNLTDKKIYDSSHVSQHALVAPGATALLTTSFRF